MSTLLLLSPIPLEPLRAISMPGMGEWMIILVIVLVIFGPAKLPQIGEALGRSIKGFKKAVSGQEEIDVTPPDQLSEGQSRAGMSHSSTEDQRTRVR